MSALALANVIAFGVLLLAAGKAYFIFGTKTESGRAIQVLMLSCVMLAALGLLRRSGSHYIDDAAFATWVVMTAVGFWVFLTRRTDRAD